MRSLFFFAFLLFSVNSHSIEFAISPMLIDINGKPNIKVPFKFTVHPKDNGRLKVHTFDVLQLESGHMGFFDPKDNKKSFSHWVKINEPQFTVHKDKSYEVVGAVKIPSKAQGTKLFAIMIEEDRLKSKEAGVNVSVRYAVILRLTLPEKNVLTRKKVKFSDLIIVQKDNKTFLQGWFKNDSLAHHPLRSVIQIRHENNRLLERVELKTESAWQRSDLTSDVYPGSFLKVYGEITKPFSTGLYKLVGRNKFGKVNLPVYKTEVLMTAINIDGKNNGGQWIELSPHPLNVKTNKLNRSFSTFVIRNNNNKEVSITFPEYDSSGENAVQFSPNSINLAPNTSKRIILKQQYDEDSPQQRLFDLQLTSDDKEMLLRLETNRS